MSCEKDHVEAQEKSWQFLNQQLHFVLFVLENEIIVEDHLFRFNPYKEYLTIINKQEEFKKIAHENFQNEINNFIKNNKIWKMYMI